VSPVEGVVGSQAVDRAAALVATIVDSPAARSFTSLVEELGLARSTTSRLLNALERGRLVERDRAGSFRPGALFAVYAARHHAVHDVVELIHPVLESLAQDTGETVNFAVPRGSDVVQVAQVDGRFLLGTTNWVGVEVPAHCSALGKVFFAEGAIAVPQGPLERRTPATVTLRSRLERELDEVRRTGYAVAWEELEVGLVAIAAPVRSQDGGTVGAISISGPTARLTRPGLPEIADLLLAAACQASSLLGYRRASAPEGGGPDVPTPRTGSSGREGAA
jgi:DNA-binding IclR family transcriptional regulator